MYPEAGGSSSFARRAFNEFWSFFAAWAQMLTYIDDDRDLGVLRPALHRRAVLGGAAPLARRHHRRRGRDRRAGGRSTSSASRSRPALNVTARGRRLPDPAAAGAGRRRARALAADAGRQRPPRRRADLERLHPRDPDRHARLHGHRDDLEHGRGGQGRGARRSRRRSTACGSPCSRSTSRCRPSRCRRCRSRRTPTASTRRCSACPRRRAATPATRSSASSSRSTSGRCRTSGEIYVGLLAATILFLATNAGLIGVSRLVYSMGIHRQLPDALRQLHPQYRTPWIGILVFSGVAIVVILPGQETSSATSTRSARCCRSRSRTLGGRGCGRSSRTSRGPTAAPATCSIARLRRAAVRDRRRHRSPAIAFVVIVVAEPDGGRVRRRLAGRRDRRLRRLPPPPGARPHLHAQGRDRRSRSSTTRRSTTPCSSTSATSGYDEQVVGHRAPSSRPASAAASTCW